MAGGAAAWVESILAKMTLEQKLAQIQCAGVDGKYVAEKNPRFAEAIDLARRGIGLFVIYGGTPRDIAYLTNRLQKEAKVPLIFTSDFENGPGQQIAGASEIPANMALAATGSEELVRRATAMAAAEGRVCGIHGTYSPVADTTWDPENPAESVRSMGGDLKLIERIIGAYVDGYHKGTGKYKMFCVSKHFPGRGDTKQVPSDPDWGCIEKSADVVMKQDIGAFAIPIAAGVSTGAIERELPPRTAVVRAMPNAGAFVGASATACCAGHYATPEHLALALALFGAVGVSLNRPNIS
jgi:beta-N-acetylhexosaminidase